MRINWTGSSKCVRADKSCPPLHQFEQSREQVLGQFELHLKHARSSDANAEGQGSGLSGSAATGSLTCRVRQSRRSVPSPLPAVAAAGPQGKRLAALHALERRNQILAPDQKRAAGLVAAKLVQQADGGAAADSAAFLLSWRDRRRGQGRSGAGRGRWQAGETTGASGAFWVESYYNMLWHSCAGERNTT